MERDCKNCKHYVVVCFANNDEVKGCEKWECEFESEEVYNFYTDTGGDAHWSGTRSGNHTVVEAED